MCVRVDMSSLELNREHVSTQEIGVKNHRCAYVRELTKFQCNGKILYTLQSSYEKTHYYIIYYLYFIFITIATQNHYHQ